MLYYKNSRFHFGGMSFALPENILIDTDYERDTPNGFAFLSHDRKIRITGPDTGSHSKLQGLYQIG